MKRRISALLLVIVLLLAVSLPVSAAKTEYIIDETNKLSEQQLTELNSLAEQLSKSVGYTLVYAYTNADSNEFKSLASSYGTGSDSNQVVLIENDDYWNIFTFGKAEEIIDVDTATTIHDDFSEIDVLSEAIELYLKETADVISKSIVPISLPEGTDGAEPVVIADADGADGADGTDGDATVISVNPPRVVDNGELLSDDEEQALAQKLDEISERQQMDVVVVTTNSLDGKSAMAYADDYFDYNGYGMGENRDGILMLVSMEDRDYWLSTRGYGITVFTDAGIDYISEQFKSYLSDGEYVKAFDTFADLCDSFITQAKTDRPYDRSNLPKEPFNVFLSIIIALVAGFVIAFVVTGIMKSKLKSVHFQAAAGTYVKQGSMNVTESRDLFLYSTVNRVAKPKNEDSGSSTHTSSSGATHGGGGGKF